MGGNKAPSTQLLSLFGYDDIKDDWSALSGHTMAAVHSAVLCRALKWGAGDPLTADERGVLKAHDTQDLQ